MNAWLYGLLLLGAWALLTYFLWRLKWERTRQILISITLLAVASLFWNYTARQPRLRIDEIVLRKLPSSVQPGLVELSVRNTGGEPARLTAFPVAYLAPLFRDARELSRGNIEPELEAKLKAAKPLPASGSIDIAPGATGVVTAEIPFSELAWRYNRGDMTILVATRLEYPDRIFGRERLFCQFTHPQAGEWIACPFLND
jgi:hypothetical protein